MSKLVKITLHGELGESIGKDWELSVSSVGEAVRAIETISKRKLYKHLIERDKVGVKYGVLINGREFLCQETPTVEKPETIANSELAMKIHDLHSIDIVPIIEGNDGKTMAIINIVVAIILIVIGIVLLAGLGWTGWGAVFSYFLITSKTISPAKSI